MGIVGAVKGFSRNRQLSIKLSVLFQFGQLDSFSRNNLSIHPMRKGDHPRMAQTQHKQRYRTAVLINNARSKGALKLYSFLQTAENNGKHI